VTHRFTRRSCLLSLLGALSGCMPPIPSQKNAFHTSSINPLFRDVAAEAGLDYRWVIPGPRPLNILQTIGNGCAFLDFDNDGNLDILLVGPTLALFHNDGKGHFQNVTQQTGLDRLHGHFLGCAVGDYDNDGYVDIYITAYRGGVLLHNEGGSHFKDVTAQSGIAPQPWGTSAAWVQTTNSGYLDLIVGNYVVFGPHSAQLCAAAGNTMTACSPQAYPPERATFYRNQGNGRFKDATLHWKVNNTSGKVLGIASADIDSSGRQSLYLANDEVPADLLLNLGSYFRNVGSETGTAYNAQGGTQGGMGTDWGDYDNDGQLDLVVATFQQEPNALYHNDGQLLFEERARQLNLANATIPYVAFGAKWIDYDNDGWLDLIFSNGHTSDNVSAFDPGHTYRQPTQLFHNRNGSRFLDVTAQAGPDFLKPIVGRGLAIGDYDNDGRLDVLIVDAEGAPLLLHNETPSAGNWVQCRLQGTKSNRDGLGALVWVRTEEGKRYLRLCQTDGSYMSASDKRVHCGVGSAKVVDIEVRWPSGQVDAYRQIPTNRIVSLTEGNIRKKEKLS